MERTTNRNLIATHEFAIAQAENADCWVPACGGHEVPFQYRGTTYLYVYNHAKRDHGYLNLATDIVEPDGPWGR